MTPEDFERSMEFSLLSPTEKEFTITLIETGNLSTATKAAFPRSKNQATLRAKMRRSPHVLAALRLWYGRPLVSPQEQAADELRKQIRKLRGVAKVQALKLLFQLEGALE